ncbi:AAA family ATPase [Leptotrichia sp. oral taxon 218]|uniref:AAA family ATPase n=1 Tax=Leptotrichia sp. oral taxon 218 TaxID=712361 RepID=UPI001B8D5432|nr:ATP-binding protein [Leptotrichia sp. oral taxon 218]QUB95114.1 AAA family ATPase [Leptotrichia sp. oral taxon 218]
MKLTINNIGKLKNAEVVIDGITVITGENDTGKSTVGKVLWSVFNGFYEIDEKVYNEKVSELKKIIDEIIKENVYKNLSTDYNSFFEIFNSTGEKIAIEFLKENKNYSEDEIKIIINNYKKDLKIENISKFVQEINETLKISDKEIIKVIVSRVMNKEFHNQINAVFSKEKMNIGEINLKIKDKEIDLKIENNEISDVQNYFLINKETMYIDNPFILDSYDFEDENHQTHLATNVFSENENSVISEIKVKKKLNNIYQKLNSVLSGEILENKNSKFVYRKNGEDIDLKNLSTGLKTFAIIKMLLQNGTLEENGTIILDEPEIHLHPEWQLKFAELIVLLQREFGMHILLTTHSPYFLNAIEVFSERHKIDDKCKYYVAENEGNSSIIKDVTGNTREIYRKLARPIQDLENIRYSSDLDE